MPPRYSWQMLRLLLPSLSIAGLLLLPGCSNAEAEACDRAKLISDGFLMKASEYGFEYEVANKLKESFSQSLAGHNYSLAREQNLRARKVIVDNPSCFTPEQVTQAELLVKENNEMCELARNENADYLERARGKTRCVDL